MILPPQPRRCCRSQSGIAGCSRRAQRRYPFLDARAPTPPSPTTRPRPFRRQPATHAARRQPAVMSASSRVSRPPAHALLDDTPRPTQHGPLPQPRPCPNPMPTSSPSSSFLFPPAVRGPLPPPRPCPNLMPTPSPYTSSFPTPSCGARAAAPTKAVSQPHAHSSTSSSFPTPSRGAAQRLRHGHYYLFFDRTAMPASRPSGNDTTTSIFSSIAMPASRPIGETRPLLLLLLRSHCHAGFQAQR